MKAFIWEEGKSSHDQGEKFVERKMEEIEETCPIKNFLPLVKEHRKKLIEKDCGARGFSNWKNTSRKNLLSEEELKASFT